MIDLVELKALVEKATPGPWDAVKAAPTTGGCGAYVQCFRGDIADCYTIDDVSREIVPFQGERSQYDAALIALAPTLARQVLALSEEVEQHAVNYRDAVSRTCELQERFDQLAARFTAAESEAQALRERMGEIRDIAITRRTFTDRAKYADVLEAAMRRIAALSTTPKEKEG